MAIGEETFVDAPITPAPVFAYRALRAVFWGDAETPEPATNRILPERDEDLLSIEASQNLKVGSLQLTPSQKRKRSVLAQTSPTKSILRTPGAQTPRRAMLKDLNVKFMDLRKSISPELAFKGSEVGSKKQLEALNEKENRPFKSSLTTDTKLPAARTTRATQSPPKSNMQQQQQSQFTTAAKPATAPTTTHFNAEEYRLNTEKEMKKLIKYGQKMREHARRQDEENVKLRLLLNEMRQENERLQKQLDENSNAKSHSRQQQQQQQPDRTRTREPSRRESLAAPIAPNPPQPLIDFSPQKTQPKLQPQHRKHTLPLPLIPHSDASASAEEAQPSPAKKRRSSPRSSSAFINDDTRRQQQQLPLRPLTNTTASGSGRLAPDRLAAARARVRQKAELRKASSLGENGGEYGSGGGDGNNSVLEWAGL